MARASKVVTTNDSKQINNPDVECTTDDSPLIGKKQETNKNSFNSMLCNTYKRGFDAILNHHEKLRARSPALANLEGFICFLFIASLTIALMILCIFIVKLACEGFMAFAHR